MKQIQNNQKSTGNPYQPMGLKNPKKKICEPKVLRLLPNICDFQIENHNPGYEFKNLYSRKFID
jgi:hypothetical protein